MYTQSDYSEAAEQRDMWYRGVKLSQRESYGTTKCEIDKSIALTRLC